jgi:quercetin dioxygenase-like cupin family protein
MRDDDTRRDDLRDDPEISGLLGALREDLAEGEDFAIQRVENRLRQPAPARSRGLPIWVTVGAMAATAVVTFVLVRPSTPPAVIEEAAETRIVAVGEELTAGDEATLVALPEGAATLSLAAGTAARRVQDHGGAPVFVLDRGVVTVDVVPGALPGLRLQAGVVEVEVLGTSFAVTRTPDEVAVHVLRGEVRVTSAGRVQELSAGESFSTLGSAPEVVSVPDGGVDVPAQDEVLTDAEAPAETVEEPGPVLTEVEQRFVAIQDALGRGAPAAELVALTSAYLDEHPASTFSAEVAAIRIEALAGAGDDRGAYDAAAQFVTTFPASPRRTQILQLQATVARDRLQDCALALEPYRALAAGGSAEASYTLAVCALDVGERDEAVAALRQYLERAPDGQHADSARELLGEGGAESP